VLAFVILHEIQMSKVVALQRQRHEIQTSQNASGKEPCGASAH
jgi:hypothetical protein